MILDVYNSLSSLKSAKKWFEFCTTGFTVKFKKPAIIAGFVVYRVLLGAVLGAVPIICNHLQVPGNFLLHFFEKSTACHAKSRS
jgi:hypothetical protein